MDGPAYIYGNSRAWFQYGVWHREDGPAIIDGDREEWWLNGEEVSEQEHARRTSKAQELTVAEIEDLLGYRVKVIKG